MTEQDLTHQPRPARRAAGSVLRAIGSLLLGPDDSGLPFRLVSFRTLFRIVGPGSVLLAIPLVAIGTQFITTDYTFGEYWPQDLRWQTGVAVVGFALWQVVPLVVAGYRALLGWFLAMSGALVVPLAVVPIPDDPQPWPWLPTALIAYLPVQYAVARRHRLWVAVVTWLLVGAAGSLMTQVDPDAAYTDTNTAQWMLAGIVMVVGAAVRTSALARQRVVQEELLTAEERARRQLLEERARIAREMHDVVAHHMSMIAVQASTAEYRHDDLPDSAKQEFASISEAARQSMTEMRRLLAVLRSDDESGERAPQPGLDSIGALVDATERSGTSVTFDARDLPADLPDAVSLTGYRIVQEALSNVVRHAPGAATTVTVDGTPTTLTIRVANEEPEGAVKRLEHNNRGHGLVGMRERTTMLGGTLRAEPGPRGGFEVLATIPLTTGKEQE